MAFLLMTFQYGTPRSSSDMNSFKSTASQKRFFIGSFSIIPWLFFLSHLVLAVGLGPVLSLAQDASSSKQPDSSKHPGFIIWSRANSTDNVPAEAVFFRRSFNTPSFHSKQTKAILQITCDDGYRIYINGQEIGSDKVWQSIESFDITAQLKTGKNAIAVQAENASSSPAGLFATIRFTDGKQSSQFHTDRTWKYSAVATPGWRFHDFKDDGWKNSFEQGKRGATNPWANTFTWQAKISKPEIRQAKRKNRTGFELVNGDRVVWLGDTFIERMQTNDYLETLLTTQLPHLDLKFRNLGWSGDNVFGLSRAVFGDQANGFRRLENDIKIADPTLIVIGYGRNESFLGTPFLPQFLAGLKNLVKVLRTTRSDIVFLSPSLMENLGPPLPDPAEKNRRIRVYSQAIREFAQAHRCHFIDNLKPLGESTVSKTDVPAIRDRLTDNGLHFNEYGYWRTAPELAKKFGALDDPVKMIFDLQQKTLTATGTTIHSVQFQENQIEFVALDDRLMACPPPQYSPRGGPMMATHDRIQINGLTPGTYGLKMDGTPTIMASHQEWSVGVLINRSKYVSQPQQLRQLILRKNEMFFHRYRPQNETYLFLFRKHEQGNNAVEIPQFDPIVEDLEKQIQQLKKAKPIRYSLSKIETTGK